jgi:hypothetical protein
VIPLAIACRAACGGLPTRLVVNEDRPHPAIQVILQPPRSCPIDPRRPCHYRATSISPEGSPPDSHGQRTDVCDLGCSLRRLVARPVELALQARGRLIEACIGLAVPGRPIGPWSRRTGAPQASATGRDRSRSVRAGSVAHRDHRGTSGQQRSPAGKRNPQVSRIPAQAARTTPAAGSGCGPQGHQAHRPRHVRRHPSSPWSRGGADSPSEMNHEQYDD